MTNRYTANELHGDTYYTLPDGAEFVLASDYAKLEANLAAANATLDRLREEFKRDCGCLATCCANARAILYPTPEISDAARAVFDEVCKADAARLKPKESHCLPCKWCGKYTYGENGECNACQTPENDNGMD